jgi:hypothetical protein
MDKELSKALMRAEAAEALLEELRDRNEELEAENARLKAQMEGKPAVEDKEPSKTHQKIIDDILFGPGPQLDYSLVEQLRKIMEVDVRIPMRGPERHARFEFEAAAVLYSGDVRVSMYHGDGKDKHVLSVMITRYEATKADAAHHAAQKLLTEYAKRNNLDPPPVPALEEAAYAIRRAMNKLGRKF